MQEKSLPWGKINFKDSQFTLPLRNDHSISIQRRGDEVIICDKWAEEEFYHRYVTGEEYSLFIEPALPDLPVILNPLYDISILPSKKLNAFIEIPFFIKILYGSTYKKTTLIEIPQLKLSKSFFGHSENGEFAYFLDSSIRQSISDYDNPQFSIYCPLSISNKSSKRFGFEKMIFRVPYLSIYETEKYLIAGRVSIAFRGHDQASQISYIKSPPEHEGDIRLLTHPRMAEDKNLLKKSFYFIKNLYDVG